MEDSVQVACVKPNAADTAFQIYSMKRSAYAAVLRAFCARSDILSGDKVRCLTELRNELKILQTEHAECLVKAISNKQIKPFSAGLHSKGNTCSTEVIKDFVACVLPAAGDTAFQIHCLERSAYASVLRAFCAVTNHLSWVKLLSELKSELRITHTEHKEVVMKVSSDEHIKSLRKFSLANLSVVTKTNPAFDVHAVLHDKIGSTGQAQEKNLLDALAKLSEVPYDVAYFGANHNHGPVNLNEHDDGKGDEAVLPKLVSSSVETSPETRLRDGGTENKGRWLDHVMQARDLRKMFVVPAAPSHFYRSKFLLLNSQSVEA
ncbi:hypothetical protein PVAP13_4KG388100 [Panicum virgatum]|uniref:ENT domain-containing protein n=1 Tax=Panicum virgatum TaxID=38727 RepID=A0A8T0TPC0_PANVG|nr:hypothetical protein PVAP13_4KG388100 [Panicum virgatum]KAG2613881.1 hypothetical protein PVAP13_4KG388100 [Panicum virgatum]